MKEESKSPEKVTGKDVIAPSGAASLGTTSAIALDGNKTMVSR